MKFTDIEQYRGKRIFLKSTDGWGLKGKLEIKDGNAKIGGLEIVPEKVLTLTNLSDPLPAQQSNLFRFDKE